MEIFTVGSIENERERERNDETKKVHLFKNFRRVRAIFNQDEEKALFNEKISRKSGNEIFVRQRDDRKEKDKERKNDA